MESSSSVERPRMDLLMIDSRSGSTGCTRPKHTSMASVEVGRVSRLLSPSTFV